MSELNYVKAGQSVGASTINGIIDALGGPSIPTEGGFVKTSQGSIFKKSYNLGSNSRSFQSELLDVKFSDAPRALSCSYKMIWIQLGRDIDCAKDRLDARHIYFYDKTSDQIKELEASDFDVNGEYLSYDGYVCTNISAIQPFKVKNGESEETVGEGDGYLYGVYIKHEDDSSSTKYVITNESNSKSVAEKVSASEYDVKRVEKIATVTKDRDGFEIIKIPLPAKADIIDGDSDIDFSKESLSGNVQLSSIHRYEKDGDTWYQLFNFDKNDVSSYAELSSKKPALLVRTSETNDGKEKHILEYVALSALSCTSCSADSEIDSLNLSSIAVADTKGDGKAYQLYNFDKDTTTSKDELSAYKPAILVRKINGNDHTLEYVALSDVSSGEGTPCSADSEIQSLNLSSIGIVNNGDGKVYELYNFDKTNSDINAKIWTLGDLDSDKHGKTGKLIDTTTKNLLSVDILVRDNSTKQLKYMNLSVDPINVDTYSTNTKNKSLIYHKDKFQDRDYLTLKDFDTTPDTKLTATISGNGLVDITGKNTWILTKKYNPSNQMMELTYNKLQLSVDLSAIPADVRCDADVTLAQKSIQKKGDYIQLYNFTRPNITTKKTTLNSLSATYDLLDNDDAVLVRSGSQLTYKKLQIETKLPSSGGGGGETTGYTGTKTQATNLKWNTNGQYKVELWGCDFQYENGLLKSIGAEKKIATLDTVGYSGT